MAGNTTKPATPPEDKKVKTADRKPPPRYSENGQKPEKKERYVNG